MFARDKHGGGRKVGTFWLDSVTIVHTMVEKRCFTWPFERPLKVYPKTVLLILTLVTRIEEQKFLSKHAL